MSEKYGLSNKAITEEYEDLIFRKVMAQYAESQSEKIEEQIAAENAAADASKIKRLFGKKERRENAATLWKYGKKLITAAAMVVFVAVVSVSSVVVASAEAREAVAEYLYSIILKDEGNRIDIAPGWSEDIRSQRYIVGYIPKGFILTDTAPLGNNGKMEEYQDEEGNWFCFEEEWGKEWSEPYVNKEKNMEIASVNGKTVYVIKHEEGYMDFRWLEEDAILFLRGPQEIRSTLFDIVKGITLNEKYEEERTPIKIAEKEEKTYPEAEGLSEKERLGLEQYDWDGAWMPTYIPEGFVCDTSGGSSSGAHHVTYIRGTTDFIIVDQREGSFISSSEEDIYIDDVCGYPFAGEMVFNTVWVVDETIISIISNVKGIIFDIAEGMVPSEYIVEVHYEGVRYEPKYIPEGFKLTYDGDDTNCCFLNYEKGESMFSFSQMNGAVGGYVSGDNDIEKTIMIGESEALYTKNGEKVLISWFVKNELFDLFAKNLPDEEIFKIIDSLVPVE